MHERAAVQADSVWVNYTDDGPCSRVSGCVRVIAEAPGTYYCVLCWETGYTGLQVNGHPFRRQAIFSLWDQDAGKARIEEWPKRARTGRFWGEGEGDKATIPYDWDSEHVYDFDVRAEVLGTRTFYSTRLREFPDGEWRSLGRISIPGRYDFVRIGSFVENFATPQGQTAIDMPLRACAFTRFAKWASSDEREIDSDRDRLLNAARWKQTSWPESESHEVAQQVNACVEDGWFKLESGGGVSPSCSKDALLLISPARADFGPYRPPE